jgi:serine/threonine protein kinase
VNTPPKPPISGTDRTEAGPAPATDATLEEAPGGAKGGDELKAGDTVGEYTITGKIGQGGMGQVYAGVHPVIGKRVAVKVLNAGLSQDGGIVQRFIQEARAVNQIQHRNIVDIFAFGQLPSGRQYFVMEFLPGRSLKQRLAEAPAVGYEEALTVLVDVCDALAAAHAEGIVHRDLKPDNIYLAESKTGDRTVKLLDFGIAKLLRQDEALQQTRTGQPMGTPLYMSPEQCLGRSIDHRTDVYSLGVIMFEMFTGQLPFPGPSYIETVNGHLQSPPPRPGDLAEIPGSLDALILKCLEKDAGLRPQSPTELRTALIAIAGELGVQVGARRVSTQSGSAVAPVRKTPSSTAGKPVKGSSPLAIYGGIAVVAALLVAGGVLLFKKQPVAVAPAMIDLQVVSTPPGAAVFIDGKAQALLTPSVFRVPRADTLHVEVRKDGYKVYAEDVKTREGESARSLAMSLDPLKVAGGKLSVHVNAKKANWLLDGKVVAKEVDTLKIDDLAPGPHKLRVEAKGFEERESPIDIQPNQLASLEWALTPVTHGSKEKKEKKPVVVTPAVVTPAVQPVVKKPAPPPEDDGASWPPK